MIFLSLKKKVVWDLDLFLMFLKLYLLSYGGYLKPKNHFGPTTLGINIVKEESSNGGIKRGNTD